ncbi:MAG: VWA domain-containing protein [Myxococcota bacterium]|nr:VWA domain-containing protein [Myxococcota bacterium]
MKRTALLSIWLIWGCLPTHDTNGSQSNVDAALSMTGVLGGYTGAAGVVAGGRRDNQANTGGENAPSAGTMQTGQTPARPQGGDPHSSAGTPAAGKTSTHGGSTDTTPGAPDQSGTMAGRNTQGAGAQAIAEPSTSGRPMHSGGRRQSESVTMAGGSALPPPTQSAGEVATAGQPVQAGLDSVPPVDMPIAGFGHAGTFALSAGQQMSAGRSALSSGGRTTNQGGGDNTSVDQGGWPRGQSGTAGDIGAGRMATLGGHRSTVAGDSGAAGTSSEDPPSSAGQMPVDHVNISGTQDHGESEGGGDSMGGSAAGAGQSENAGSPTDAGQSENAGQPAAGTPAPQACYRVDTLEVNPGPLAPGAVATAFEVRTCADEPVPHIAEARFDLFENGIAMDAVEAALTHLERTPSIFITVVLDRSGSVAANAMDAIADAALAFVNTALNDTQHVYIGLASFDRSFTILAPHSNRLDTLTSAIEDYRLGGMGTQTTDLHGALIDALAESRLAQSSYRDRNRGGALTIGEIVLLSASDDNAGLTSIQQAQNALASTADKVQVVGVGGVTANTANALSSASGILANIAQLNAIFQVRANYILQRQHSIYALAFCSPKRGGMHAVTLAIDDGPTAPLLTFNAVWPDAVGTVCSRDAFETSCATSTCGGLWCGRCGPPHRTGECRPDFTCFCRDDHFVADQCTSCANFWSGDHCDVCTGRFAGEQCDECAPGYNGIDCQTETCGDGVRTDSEICDDETDPNCNTETCQCMPPMPGDGQYGEPCSGGRDCASGLCIPGSSRDVTGALRPTRGYCTQPCDGQGSCPDLDRCVTVNAPSKICPTLSTPFVQDGQLDVCLQNETGLPCQAAADCVPGGICLTPPNPAGNAINVQRMCAAACENSADCPVGFHCDSIQIGARADNVCQPNVDIMTCPPGAPGPRACAASMRCADDPDGRFSICLTYRPNAPGLCSCACRNAADCPVGFACSDIGSAISDRVGTCLPLAGYTCPTGQINQCLSETCYQSDGVVLARCTATCQADTDCPTDYTCQTIGNAGSYCLP